jgi:hypothetical protein
MPQLYKLEDTVTGEVYEGLSPLQLMQMQTALFKMETMQEERDTKGRALEAIDEAKKQVGLKRSLGQIDVSGIPGMQQNATEEMGSAPVTELGPQSPMPQARVLGRELESNVSPTTKSLEDIFSEQGLTDRYSQVPEVESYLETERGRGLGKEIKGFSQRLEAGEFQDEEGNTDAQRVSTALAESIAEYMPAEALDAVQGAIKKAINDTSGAYAAQQMKKATPEDFARANRVLEIRKARGYYGEGEKFREDAYLDDYGYANSNPRMFNEDNSKKRFSTQEQLRKLEEQIPIKIKDIEETTGPAAKKAGVVKATQNLAKEKLSDKVTGELTGQQNVYANLVDVDKKFSPKYLTPYFGKGFKVAYLKQNVPEFTDFTSSLGLALNEYRRENFGTAQTQTEIENFLDVLNSDLNIKPKAFKMQLDNVMNAIKRDFENVVKTKEQQNFAIPETFRKIEIPEPAKVESEQEDPFDDLWKKYGGK